ncbi:MAG TPA: sigma-54 dependent transcriptional regulator [Gemmatimonadota bacterium]|nr:sigma-54 dependent transcriptional regulator [Gemmatimonadota bacterium]
MTEERQTAKIGEDMGASEPLISDEDRSTVRILAVDDDPTSLASCESVLDAEGYKIEVERKGEDAIRRIKTGKVHIALIDQNMPGVDGMEVLQAVQEHSPSTLAIIMTGYATAEASVRALQAGAWDYLPKPFTATQLLILVDRAAHTLLRMRSLAGASKDGRKDGVLIDNGVQILGVSEVMRKAVARALKVAGTDASVFITGESGTGKEVFARCIHNESRRSQKPFVAVNCAALPGELLESEMFGHRRGAFTGAVRDKPGLLEAADRGTFFLDELAEMPIALQPKLLRVLQDGVLRRVGSEKDDAVVDVRFISATNRDPEEALDTGLIRHDLYYRLRVVPIELPPLRERPEDIPILAAHFVERFWRRHRIAGKQPPELAPETLERLVSASWPGNVRELQNVLEQVVVLSDSNEPVPPEALPPLEGAGSVGSPRGSDGGLFADIDLQGEYHTAKQELIDRFERRYLASVVARAGGNMSKAARHAGIDRTTLYRLMDKHELSKESLTGETGEGDELDS